MEHILLDDLIETLQKAKAEGAYSVRKNDYGLRFFKVDDETFSHALDWWDAEIAHNFDTEKDPDYLRLRKI